MIFSIIAYASLSITIIALLLAITGNPKFYWLAALSNYIFSILAGFTIGQLTVGLTFLFLLLAIGHSFRLIKTKMNHGAFVLVGLFIGFVSVAFVDDYWLFFPLAFFG